MTKNSREIICAHKDFFSGLVQIQTIVVIGHSLSEVDMDYYAEILRQVWAAGKLRWIISCHDESGLKSIEAFARRFGIASSQITVFFL